MQKLFEAALGITSPWYVKTIDFDVAQKRLRIDVDFEAGSSFKDESEGSDGRAYKGYSSLSIKVPFSIFQSFINCGINIFEFIAYLSDVRLHHCPVIFNGVKIWRIWGQIKQ